MILPDDLHVRAIPRPGPPAKEIAIALRAVGVNLDVPAWELSGVVSRAGGGFEVGDPVMGVTDHAGGPFLGVVDHGAGLADVVAPADRFVKLPAGWSFEQGGAFPVDYLHAFELVSVRGRAGAGTRVLVPGAGSALREAVLQIGRALGCDLVDSAERSVDLHAGGELEELFAEPVSMRQRFEQILAMPGVSPLVGALFPFDQMREALAYLESGRSAGKVVLTLDDF